MLIYFLRGSLPWQGITAENRKEKYEMISQKKLSTPVDVLCAGLPAEFGKFLTAVRSLEFTDRPDYAGYRQLFRDLFIREGYAYDYQYDWVVRAAMPPSPGFSFGQAPPPAAAAEKQPVLKPQLSAQIMPVQTKPVNRVPQHHVTPSAGVDWAQRRTQQQVRRATVPTWMSPPVKQHPRH